MSFPRNKARAHVVFDNDGTMINSLGNFFDLIDKVLSSHLGREVTKEEVREAYIPDWNQLFVNLGVPSPGPELLQAVIDDLNELNKGYLPELIPGTKEFIRALHELEIATYVWTGRDKASGIEVFEGLGLINLFEKMQFRDTCIPKPDPDGLEKMLGGVDKSKIVLIGDSIVDIKGAVSFGIPCLIIDWFGESGDHKELREAGASEVYTSHKEILSWIKGNLFHTRLANS